MKILLIGFLVFSGWSALSTYIFVCKIKGLCYNPVAIQINADEHKVVLSADTLITVKVPEQTAPETLVIYFAFDRSEFNFNTETTRYSDESKAYMDRHLNSVLHITGHTDSVGTRAYNQALGYRRAQRLQRYFVSKGLQANKINIISKGERVPDDTNGTPSGRANNRRAVVTIKK